LLIIFCIVIFFSNVKSYIFIFSFSLLMIMIYYIGFMVAIFVVLYFLASAIEYLYSKKKNFKDVLLLTRKFLFSSLLAGGISSIIWIPSVLSYSGSSKISFDLSELVNMNANFTLTEFLSKFIVGSTNKNQIIRGLPNVYIASNLLILCVLFF